MNLGPTTHFESSFFRMAPAKKPRTEFGCHSVTVIMAAKVSLSHEMSAALGKATRRNRPERLWMPRTSRCRLVTALNWQIWLQEGDVLIGPSLRKLERRMALIWLPDAGVEGVCSNSEIFRPLHLAQLVSLRLASFNLSSTIRRWHEEQYNLNYIARTPDKKEISNVGCK